MRAPLPPPIAPPDLRSTGCHSYHVPQHVREHVDIIQPTVHFVHRAPSAPLHRRELRKANIGGGTRTGPKTLGQKVTITPALADCDTNITPDCLRALYSVNYTPVATAKNSYGIGG